mmetsp:Transcript_30215/g.46851  ORF Transcript_30215/g.46851 Transcript_30215/m.46851 type:complete len:325 (-) Transcript_30215:110-1084(-)
MKVSLLLLLVCVGVCVLGCSNDGHDGVEKREEDGVKTSWGGEKTQNWVFSVKPNQEMNHDADPHTGQFAYLYTFCVPLQRAPKEGEEASALLELVFDGTTDEIIVDFDFTKKIDYVNKDPVEMASLTLLVDSDFKYGWAADKKLSGKVYTTAPLTHVLFKGTGSWKEVHEEDLLCSPRPQEAPQKPTSEISEEPSDVRFKREHYPYVFLLIALLGFMSVMICCCTLSTAEVPEDEDVIKEMEQFTPIPQTEVEPTVMVQPVVDHDVYIDDEEIMRRVQEESRREYEASQNEFTVGAQREALAQYMKAPVMTPEQYASFLASQPQ